MTLSAIRKLITEESVESRRPVEYTRPCARFRTASVLRGRRSRPRRARRACRGARRLRDVRCSSHCVATAADTHAPAPATRTRRAGRAHTLSSRLRATHIYSYSNPRSYHWRAIARPHLFLLRIRSRWRTSQSSRRAHSTSHSVCCATSPSPSVPLDVPVGCAPRGG